MENLVGEGHLNRALKLIVIIADSLFVNWLSVEIMKFFFIKL